MFEFPTLLQQHRTLNLWDLERTNCPGLGRKISPIHLRGSHRSTCWPPWVDVFSLHFHKKKKLKRGFCIYISCLVTRTRWYLSIQYLKDECRPLYGVQSLLFREWVIQYNSSPLLFLKREYLALGVTIRAYLVIIDWTITSNDINHWITLLSSPK